MHYRLRPHAGLGLDAGWALGGDTNPEKAFGATLANTIHAFKYIFTCVNPLVDLQILRAGKDLATAGKGAREGLLSSVDAEVVDQLVLCLEWLLLAWALLPVAGVVRDLGPANMVDSQVGDDVVHRVELLVAPLSTVLFVNPLARHLLLHRLTHVPEEGAAHPIHVAWVHVVLGICPVSRA